MDFCENRAGNVVDYPPMSHPSADPLVLAAVARAAGLTVTLPNSAKILDIGCAEGHHILSLASRWPTACCTGLDASPKLIQRASQRAKRAGLSNVAFHEKRLSEFITHERFDFIIAHGFFSWVKDEVKVGLMDFIQQHLSPQGVAVVSFNVAAGWKARMEVVKKVLAIQSAGDVDIITALNVLRTLSDEAETTIVNDMLAKGAAILAYDDFAPVMDAWSLGAFVKLAQQHGLMWLGDSQTGDKGSDAADGTIANTFRSEILCRADAQFVPFQKQEAVLKQIYEIPDFPKLNPWRMLCVRELLPVVDKDLKPCVFTMPQLKVMLAMDGTLSSYQLSLHAKEVAPELHFVPWLKHVAERGIFTEM